MAKMLTKKAVPGSIILKASMADSKGIPKIVMI
jgi:hypothetical protein